MRSETAITSSIKKPSRSLLGGWGDADSLRIKDDLHFWAMLMWSEPNFSGFAFDLVALLNGTFEIGRLSSFHAFGTSQWAEAKKKEQEEKKKK